MKTRFFIGGLITFIFTFFLTGCAQVPPASPAAITSNPTKPSISVPVTAPTAIPFTSTPAAAIPSQPAQAAATSTTLQTQALPSPTQQPTQSPPTPTAQQLQNTQAPTAQPTQAAPVATATLVSGCTNTAGFFGDVTIPDGTSFQQKQSFTKTWKIRNEGTCTWGTGYAVVFYGGDQMSGPLSNPMPVAAPGDIINVSVDMVSPSSGGAFTGLWEFQDANGYRFGVNSGGIDQIWVKIGVTIFNASGTIVPVGSTPVPTAVGQELNKPSGGCSPLRNSDYEQQILASINAARTQQGLNALKLNDQLSTAAYLHSVDMACQRFVDHTGSDGSTWFTRIKAQKYKYTYASENIYVGNPSFGGTAAGAFTWWMNSQIHHDNILSPKITEIGIGCAYLASSEYGGYYTTNFTHP